MFQETVEVLGIPSEGSLSEAELLASTLERIYLADASWKRSELTTPIIEGTGP